jgi:hypothetical protein
MGSVPTLPVCKRISLPEVGVYIRNKLYFVVFIRGIGIIVASLHLHQQHARQPDRAEEFLQVLKEAKFLRRCCRRYFSGLALWRRRLAEAVAMSDRDLEARGFITVLNGTGMLTLTAPAGSVTRLVSRGEYYEPGVLESQPAQRPRLPRHRHWRRSLQRRSVS